MASAEQGNGSAEAISIKRTEEAVRATLRLLLHVAAAINSAQRGERANRRAATTLAASCC
ncbi:MAG: hypothetical protein M0004_13790 [Actinomycetota bacterium]|nr:hypothetical protein [Actinomycetota bacterium]